MPRIFCGLPGLFQRIKCACSASVKIDPNGDKVWSVSASCSSVLGQYRLEPNDLDVQKELTWLAIRSIMVMYHSSSCPLISSKSDKILAKLSPRCRKYGAYANPSLLAYALHAFPMSQAV